MLLVSAIYFVISVAFGEFASRAASSSLRETWNRSAFLVSGLAFAVHIGYEHFRLRDSASITASHTALAVAGAAFALRVSEAAKEVGQLPNEVGNIIVDTEDCHMLLEAEGNFISYVQVDFKKVAPCYWNQEFDSEPILGALSINPAELDLIRKQPHFHTYHDHRKKLQISVSCSYDGGPLSVGFSTKYYGV